MFIDDWIKRKIGLKRTDTLTRTKLEEYQLFKLRETLYYVKNNSKFYNNHLRKIEPTKDLTKLKDISKLPFTTPEMLKKNGHEMICVPQSEISRVVTLSTSGSTGDPKRIFFTEKDQELTIDYFHYGMQVMTTSDDVLMVLMPCKTPGSVGELLRIGLERNGVEVITYGYPGANKDRDSEIIGLIKDKKVTSLVGNAPVIARLAKRSADEITSVKTVLLSAEYVSEENVKIIENSWHCRVFEHYGMTETGLGGAMACIAHQGYHPREADLLFEVIDPNTNLEVPPNQRGELIFTTLTRTGMPLIRYKTGDFSKWLTGNCPCGSILKRFDKVEERSAPKGEFFRIDS